MCEAQSSYNCLPVSMMIPTPVITEERQQLELARDKPKYMEMSILLNQTGWLTKLGFKSGKWQKRYFVLNGNTTLTYSKSPGGSEKGQLLLDKSTDVRSMAVGETVPVDALPPGTKLKTPVGEHVFMVTSAWETGRRSFLFQVTSPPFSFRHHIILS